MNKKNLLLIVSFTLMILFSINNVGAKSFQSTTSSGDIVTSTGSTETNTGELLISSGTTETSTGEVVTNSGLTETNTGEVVTSTGSTETNTGELLISSGTTETSTGEVVTNSGLTETNTGKVDKTVDGEDEEDDTDKKETDSEYPSDITGNFAQKYFEILIDKGIMEGDEDNTMKPDELATRQDFLKILLLAKGIDFEDTDTNELAFKDLDKESEFASVAAKAIELNIISGKNTNFRGDKSISRDEVLKMLLNTFDFKTDDVKTSTFSDVEGWAVKYVEKAKDLKIITAKDKFRPKNGISKAEVAKMVYNTMQLDEKISGDNQDNDEDADNNDADNNDDDSNDAE